MKNGGAGVANREDGIWQKKNDKNEVQGVGTGVPGTGDQKILRFSQICSDLLRWSGI